jgi:hypothetical protein
MTNRLWALLLVWIVALACVSPSRANPWHKLLPFKRVEADPNKNYPVTDENGPWMVLATVFRGENAERQAQKLVYELRKKFKLEAYTHAQVFDYTHDVRGRGFMPDGTPKIMRHAQDDAVKEVAVLVGNFGSIDDDRATDTLQKIKTIEPDSLSTDPAKSSQVFAGLRQAMNARKKKGPMGAAFVVTNPLLPPEFFNTPGVDKLVLEMNEDVPYSLLKCPGKYTLKVATFTGSSILNQQKVRDASYSKKVGYSLQEAAENAHELADALRRQGFEAYEFHDREQSIVTVGNFEQLAVAGPNGQSLTNPQVDRLMKLFGVQVNSTPGNPLMGIPSQEVARRKQAFPKTWKLLDLQPAVIPVPWAPLSAAYRR